MKHARMIHSRGNEEDAYVCALLLLLRERLAHPAYDAEPPELLFLVFISSFGWFLRTSTQFAVLDTACISNAFICQRSLAEKCFVATVCLTHSLH